MTPRERLFALEQFGVKLGLDNIRTIVAALGRPDRCYHTVHIGGTNGKGSVTAMVERGLRAAGHRTGRYTSPHLVDIEERVAIDGRPVHRTTFDAVAGDVLGVIDRLVAEGTLPGLPTFFEATTAIAFETFRQARSTAAVIEVGLGGRFDATNVIEPTVTAITSIAFDHERHLGSTLSAIAYEKAGIIKEGIPLVVGDLPAEADAVVTQTAQERHVPIYRACTSRTGTPLTLALNGAHQRTNAAVAVAVLKRCAFQDLAGRRDEIDQFSRASTPIAHQHIITALTNVEWPARLEWLHLAGSGDVLIDAAHNPAGARAVADYVRATTGPLPMVIGVMRDKDVSAILRELAPAVSRFIVTAVSSPRAMTPGALSDCVRATLPATACETQSDPGDAIRRVCREYGRAMIAGSIFLVGPVRAALVAEGAVPVRYPSETSLFYLD